MTEKNGPVMNLETMLESLRNYLSSEISIDSPNQSTIPENSGKTKNIDQVNVKVKVRNNAPPKDGYGELVFVGVGLTITCNATNQIFEKLKNTVKKHTVQQWQAQPRSTVIWYVNTWVEEDWDEGYNTQKQKKIDGDTLFPGETKDYEFNVPFESLPYISIKVDGYISPGNLFHSGKMLPGFEKWSKPELTASVKDLINLNVFHPIKMVSSRIPEFGPQTTFEQITTFRNTLTEVKTEINNIKEAAGKVFKNHYYLEIISLYKEAIFPYLNSVEKTCDNVITALASGNMDKITESIKELKSNSDKSKEIEQKIRNLVLKSGIEPKEMGLN